MNLNSLDPSQAFYPLLYKDKLNLYKAELNKLEKNKDTICHNLILHIYSQYICVSEVISPLAIYIIFLNYPTIVGAK